MSRRGKFITFEGPEGSGKSTHAAVLMEQMTSAGYPVIAARDPGGTVIGEEIRHVIQQDTGSEPMRPETELFLFMASRAQLVREVILPALGKGTHVVCDRFADSTTAYQGYGRGYDMETIFTINNMAVQDLTPDITILLDIDVKLGFERLKQRHRKNRTQNDRIENEAMAFHERVRSGYLELARRWTDRFHVVDTSSLPISDIKEEIWKAVRYVLDK